MSECLMKNKLKYHLKVPFIQYLNDAFWLVFYTQQQVIPDHIPTVVSKDRWIHFP